MKLILAKLENNCNYNVLWDGEENLKKAAYFNDLKYIDKKEEKEFKEKFGFNLRTFREKSIDEVKKEIEKRFSSNEEMMIEEFENFIDNLPYAPQAYPGCYCEDIILKEDIEELEKENVLFLTGDYFQDTGMSDEEYYDYYFWWDGHNYRCSKIEELYKVECEKIDCDEVDCEDSVEQREGTYHYNCYRTNEEKIFRIFCSHYPNVLDELDEKCGAALDILE